MGLLESFLQFTGSIGNVSAFKVRGVDKIVVRKKGGPSRKEIENSPRFGKTRLLNKEFSGRATGVHWMLYGLRRLKIVADHNITGPLNRLLKYVQYRDEESTIGKRTIALSKHGSLLEGFSLNKYTDLNKIVTAPFTCSVSRETLSATVDIPELIPGSNFFPSKEYPFFSVMAVLYALPDLIYVGPENAKKIVRDTKPYAPVHPGFARVPNDAATVWLRADETTPATSLEVKLTSPPPADNYALMLSLGISFATPAPGGTVEAVKYAGAGKIVKVI